MHFGPSRDGLCLSFIGNVDVCPFSLSRSPRRSRFVSHVLSLLSLFLAPLVFRSLSLRFLISFFSISLPPCADVFFLAAAAAAGRVSPPPPRPAWAWAW